MPATVKEIIQEGIRKKYGSLYEFCRVHRIHYPTLYGVLNGSKVSRPLIFLIAKDLNMPELCFLYEEFLHEKRMGSKGVENNGDESTEERGGGKDV